MSRSLEEEPQTFGSDTWTSEKLEILRAYLDAYTTALKNQRFTLIYVDAFAGSGAIEVRDDEDGRRLLDGSPVVAANTRDKPFDRLVFIEKDRSKSDSLTATLNALGAMDRSTVAIEDANQYLPRFCSNLGPYDRAVVLLDPFGTQVDWETVSAIAHTEKCDTWILFPVGTIRRLLQRRGDPSRGRQDRLDRVFGGSSWRDLQHPVLEPSMFDEAPAIETDPGVEGIIAIYRDRLGSAFAQVAPASRTLRNSRNVPLYELMFAAANHKGAEIAVRIANHILTKI